MDEGSWERLAAAVEISIPSLADRLAKANNNAEPMVATLVPKPGGDFRLKALPCPDALTLQQYLLNEILREQPEAPEFARAIPAVRYASGQNRGRPWTTGDQRAERAPETVSFAYQVDMDVVEGRAAPQREGMFRPYWLCWREFIGFIDRRAAACRVRATLLYVARLDIRRFYDSIPRSIVIDALLPGLRDALSALADASQAAGSATACAPLFEPSRKAPEERAHRIVDWLCDESFNFVIEHPKTGERETQRRGIPQGPDLSAYLANIVLFQLDYELQRIVEELDERACEEQGSKAESQSARGGVYARYVDDMVLIARTPHDLAAHALSRREATHNSRPGLKPEDGTPSTNGRAEPAPVAHRGARSQPRSFGALRRTALHPCARHSRSAARCWRYRPRRLAATSSLPTTGRPPYERQPRY